MQSIPGEAPGSGSIKAFACSCTSVARSSIRFVGAVFEHAEDGFAVVGAFEPFGGGVELILPESAGELEDGSVRLLGVLRATSADPTGITRTDVRVTAARVSGAGHAATVEEPGVDGCRSLGVPFSSALVAECVRSGRNRSRPAVRCELCSIPGAPVEPYQMTRKRLETVGQLCRSGLERACGARSVLGSNSPLGRPGRRNRGGTGTSGPAWAGDSAGRNESASPVGVTKLPANSLECSSSSTSDRSAADGRATQNPPPPALRA